MSLSKISFFENMRGGKKPYLQPLSELPLCVGRKIKKTGQLISLKVVV